jgi:hypothetical protein
LDKEKEKRERGTMYKAVFFFQTLIIKKVKLDPPISVKNNTDIFLIMGILILLVICERFLYCMTGTAFKEILLHAVLM